MNTKLGIWTSYYMELDVKDAVKRFIDNGIYCAELSDEHGLKLLEADEDVVKTGREFAAFLKENSFEMTQGHLWLYAKICSDPDAVDILCRWIDLYEAIGVKTMVLHCDPLLNEEISYEEKLDRNVERLKLLAEHIRDKDIYICLENLNRIVPSVDDILYIIEKVGSDRLAVCLDTGHLNLTLKNQREFILKAGDKLKALHIADNRGEKDDHLMPYGGGTVDFCEVVSALREVGYCGMFNLEIPGERSIPLELRDAKLAYIKRCYAYLMK